MVKGRKGLLIVILKEKINVDKLPADLRVYISKYDLYLWYRRKVGSHILASFAPPLHTESGTGLQTITELVGTFEVRGLFGP